MLRAVGFQDADFSKPQIGIASTWANITPCNMHIAELAREAVAGADAAGGKGVLFNTITVSDGISMGSPGMRYSLVSREVIADSIELVTRGNLFDALIVLVGCDMPFLTVDWLQHLASRAIASKAEVVVPESTYGLEPLCACWRVSAAPLLTRAFDNGVRRVTDAMKQQDPVASGMCRAHLPSAKCRAVLSIHAEIFACRVNLREGDIRIPN